MQLKKLTLLTDCLEAMRSFYTELLGFKLLRELSNEFVLQIGKSQLSFQHSQTNAYYHFAFNIPSNKIEGALDWLEKKGVKILPFEEKKIVQFQDWNAEAIYFNDPAGNIVELIARKNLKIDSAAPFSIQEILSISEIGLAMENPASFLQMLTDNYGILKYSGDGTRFAAMGKEEGLFIIVDPNHKKWIPTFVDVLAFPLKIIFEHEGTEYILSNLEKDSSFLTNYQITES